MHMRNQANMRKLLENCTTPQIQKQERHAAICGFPEMGVPPNGWFIMEHPTKIRMMTRGTLISENHHIPDIPFISNELWCFPRFSRFCLSQVFARTGRSASGSLWRQHGVPEADRWCKRKCELLSLNWNYNPIGSMYGIFTYIWAMDPMGMNYMELQFHGSRTNNFTMAKR